MARAALENRRGLERKLSARVPRTWPGADFARMLPVLARSAESGWSARLVVYSEERVLIGDAGFHGPPDGTGTVEIGYSIVPEYRGRGFAFEAAEALVAYAFTHPRVRRVTAECLHDNQPSLKILRKLGMLRVGHASETLRFEIRARDLPDLT